LFDNYNASMAASKKTSRRDFLAGRSALRAVEGLIPDEDTDAPDAAPPKPKSPLRATKPEDATYLLQIGRTAMACEFEFFLNAGQHANGTEAALEALDLVEQLEDQMTVYRDHSEIVHINEVAAFRPLPVESRLFALLEQALQLHEFSGGAFDITAGPLSRLWGFYRREGRFPPQEELDATREIVGSQWIHLDREQSTIRFQKPGVELNLGAIGKGYALDRCAELMIEREVDSFMVHGGQSSILARGARQRVGEAERDGWQVALRHPLKNDQRLAEITLRDQALGTSGSGRQFFYHKGRRYGHVLDPRTGQSAEGVLSATVIAPTAALADALSTTFFVLGVDATQVFCDQHPGLAVVFVLPGRRAGELSIRTINLDDNSWRRLDA
jgi:thiamine biosynthesis lipoprotein